MSKIDYLESSGSEAEVVFKQKRQLPKSSDLSPPAFESVRRGNRPRVKPRSHADFQEMSPRRSRRPVTRDSSSEEVEEDNAIESCRKNATSLFADDDIHGQEMFQFKSRRTKLDLQNKVSSAVANSPRSPGVLTPKTTRKGRVSLNKRVSLLSVGENTPKHVKDIIKKRIIEEIGSEHSDSDFSASSSDFVPDKSDESSSPESSASEDEAPRPPAAQTRTRRLAERGATVRRDADYVVTPDNYFLMHSSKKNTTSDHTLERLKNYNPIDTLTFECDHLSDEHKEKIIELNKSHEQFFDKWLYVLGENCSVLLYGVGSKRAILQRFQAAKLKEFPCIVVNGFFPSLTIKSVLEAIIVDLLECSQVPSNVRDTVALIEEQLSEQGIELFLIVHNIDGVMLQSNKAQAMLASLSRIKSVHTIATIDHINAPLMWDHTKLGKFNWTWWDVTTFLPYSEESSFEGGLAAQRTGGLQLASLRSVHRSLTSNAKRIFRLLLDHQLKHQAPHYQGLPFKDLYSKSREQFLVSSDIALRAQLTEFLDHKLVKIKRSADGSENLNIPIDNGLLQQFVDQLS